MISSTSDALESTASVDASTNQNQDTVAHVAKIHDRVLVQRFNNGDDSAFIEIVERYRIKMFTVAFSRLRNRSDAEEIAQDTFVRAHAALGRFRGDSSLATWLYRITDNLARNRYWYLFRRRQHLTLSLDCPLSADSTATFGELMATEEPDPARQALTEEFGHLISACMGQLDAGHREILTLRNLLHRSYGEIAKTLGISPGTVKSRIARARENLRDLITGSELKPRDESLCADFFAVPRTAATCAA